jgi:membrane protein implicated in regulation of membrane protease activity
MWWEWLIVIAIVAVASAWTLRRAFRRLSGRSRGACSTCGESAARTNSSKLVTPSIDMQEDGCRCSDPR